MTDAEPSGGSLVELLAHRARRSPGALAFEIEGEALSYGELAGAARGLAAALRGSGLAPGGRCALALPTSLDFIRTLFAVQWLGAVPLALNPALPPALIATRARRVGAALIVAHAPLATALSAEGARVSDPRRAPPRAECEGAGLAEPRPGPLAFLQLTSGTSGEPRAAMIGQAALLAAVRASAAVSGLTGADVFAGWVPLHHDLGLVRFVFLPVFAGRPAHLAHPSLARLRGWLELAARVRATITAAPDFVYRLAARSVEPAGLDLSSLRAAVSGGEPVRLGTIRGFEARFGLPGVVRPGYGLAEATLGVSSLRPGEPLRIDAAGHVGCGRPLPGTQVRILDEGGAELPPNAAGEIVVRSASLFEGYLDDEQATRATLRDGWLHTGDVGALGEDGQLHVHGRRRALIKRGGAIVAPREIEEAVDRIAGVRLSAAVSATIHDSEDVCVVVETRRPTEGAERSAFERLVAAEVARAIGFAPGRVLLVPPRCIPRTANGKIRHAELARRLAAGEVYAAPG